MWKLVEDFFDQSWAMKLFIAWGWLAVLIMAAGMIDGIINY